MKDNINTLKKKKEEYINKLSLFLLELTVVIGVPAFIAAYIGKQKNNTALTITLLILAATVSWSYIIFRYKKITSKISELNKQIEEAEKQKPNLG